MTTERSADDDAQHEALRRLPAVGTVLARPVVAAIVAELGHAVAVRAVRDAIEAARRTVLGGGAADVSDRDVCARARRAARGSLEQVLNATGVIVHTNLGRSPLAPEALDAVREAGRGYVTLEYDLDDGGRGERHAHARDLLVALTGAEDALVVNNNAGAVLLALAANAQGKEVVVSRGELVEIGGGFRIPDVLAQSGARLVEVGTTNRTHPRDYEGALTPDTAILLKVHRSNFAIVGFTADVPIASLASIGHPRGLAVVCDAGSGCLSAALAGPDERTASSLVADGADLVLFSGDKLLGGPQAGIAVGRRALIEPMRRHPLMRALRPDKLCLAALVATLRLWRDAPLRIPVMRLASISADELERRARAIADRLAADGALGFEAVATTARIGGGAAPLRALPSWGVRVRPGDPTILARRLRDGIPPIVGRIEDDHVVLDLRAIGEGDDDRLVSAVVRAMQNDEDA